MNWNRFFASETLNAGSRAIFHGVRDDTAPRQAPRHNGNKPLDRRARTVRGKDLGYQATLARARLAMRRENWDQAEALLMRAGPIAGEDPAYFNLVGVLWEVRGNQCLARKFYGKAIWADSGYPAAQQNMRRLYELWTFGRTRQIVALGDESWELQ
jgi:hypothetical protein